MSDTSVFYHDTEEGCVIETRSNISDALVERNKMLANSGVTPQGAGMRYVGSIDPVVYQQWVKEDPDIANDTEKLFRKLQDPAYRHFLVVPRSKL